MSAIAQQFIRPSAVPQVQPARRFVSEVDLESVTGVSRKTWQKHRLMGTGPRYYKLAGGAGRGGSVRYDLGEVFSWIEAGAVDPQSTR